MDDLKALGTIVFTKSFMRDKIGYGEAVVSRRCAEVVEHRRDEAYVRCTKHLDVRINDHNCLGCPSYLPSISIDRDRAPSTLCLAVWASFIPEAFIKKAKWVAALIIKEFEFEVTSNRQLDMFVKLYRARVELDISKGYITKDGWR